MPLVTESNASTRLGSYKTPSRNESYVQLGDGTEQSEGSTRLSDGEEGGEAEVSEERDGGLERGSSTVAAGAEGLTRNSSNSSLSRAHSFISGLSQRW